jgi:gluconolactonase
MSVTEDVPDPNGIQLSPDEEVLYVGNETGEFVIAFDVQPDGRVRNTRNFARVSETGVACHANGLAVDAAGHLYVAALGGVHIFSPQGQRLGTIPIPVRPANLAFAGPDKKTLYVTARGVLYKIPMLAEGFKGRAK